MHAKKHTVSYFIRPEIHIALTKYRILRGCSCVRNPFLTFSVERSSCPSLLVTFVLEAREIYLILLPEDDMGSFSPFLGSFFIAVSFKSSLKRLESKCYRSCFSCNSSCPPRPRTQILLQFMNHAPNRVPLHIVRCVVVTDITFQYSL